METQAKVEYRKEFLLLASTESGSTLAYSSVGELNELYHDNLVPVTVKSAEIDTNFDNRIDIFDFNFTMKTDVSEIRNVKLLTFFDYKLRDMVKVDLRSMAMLDVNTPMGAS